MSNKLCVVVIFGQIDRCAGYCATRYKDSKERTLTHGCFTTCVEKVDATVEYTMHLMNH